MSYLYDPAKHACDPTFSPCTEYYCVNGPGGNDTLTENNEKGIQETKLFEVIALHRQAALGSDHDGYRQGIYTTNSIGDND